MNKILSVGLITIASSIVTGVGIKTYKDKKNKDNKEMFLSIFEKEYETFYNKFYEKQNNAAKGNVIDDEDSYINDLAKLKTPEEKIIYFYSALTNLLLDTQYCNFTTYDEKMKILESTIKKWNSLCVEYKVNYMIIKSFI